MGLPIDKLIIATNSNDILKRVVRTGIYKPSKVQYTVSPSMDIQVASNFERLIFDICSHNSERVLDLMNNLKINGEFKLDNEELKKINKIFTSESSSEEETKVSINKTFKEHGILVDPHTAVAIGVANKISLDKKTVILATAHPSKFYKVVLGETKVKPELPDSLKNILLDKEKYVKLPNDLKEIQNFILEKI